VFVLPDQVFGKAPDEIVYQPDFPLPVSATLHGRGKLADWQEQVVHQCTGNPIFMFAVMLGLAGPLLKLCRVQSGGFHLYGVTTGGKTTAAQVAASAWGCAADPQEGPESTSLRKWNSTSSALEATAEVYNDTVLILDDITEVDSQALDGIIYQLAGGMSKGRANASGGMRLMRSWRLLFLSTGEVTVRQKLAEANRTQKGGQRVRMPDIPADNDEDGTRGIVLDPHGRTPKHYTQELKTACATHYGLAGPLFVTYLIAQAEQLGVAALSDDLREELRSIEKILSQEKHGDKMEDLQLPPEGQRVVQRFALVALAGLRASTQPGMAGILPWDFAQILLAIKHVRDRWLSDLGQERSETDRGLAYLRNQLIRHGDRFRWLTAGGNNRPSRDLLGYRVPEYYLLTDEGLRELCGEHDMRAVLRALKTQNYLHHDAGRLTKKSPRIEEFGNTRPNLYWIKVSSLGEETDGFDTEEDKVLGEPKVVTAPARTKQGDIPF
jgi:uncharacterized protein (DUF927 family)